MTTTTNILKKLAALALGTLIATTAANARADTSDALLTALVKKGVLTQQEADALRAQVAMQNQTAPTSATTASVATTTTAAHAAPAAQPPATPPTQPPLIQIASGKSTTALTFTGRAQFQYLNAATTDANNTPASTTPGNPGYAYARVSHFLLRRLYVGTKAALGPNWSADITYDLASSSFDKACIEWNGDIAGAPFLLDAGLRKVNFNYDEATSSGSLKSIERSGVTRYFSEDANGRRLGTASYHVGLFADYNPAASSGKTDGLFAGLALTNPERQSTPAEISAAGSPTSNKPAAWLNLGYNTKLNNNTSTSAAPATLQVGAAAAYLPQMGGTGRTTNATGNPHSNILEGDLYADLTVGPLNLVAEYLVAQVDNGVAPIPAAGAAPAIPAKNATVSGYWIQPSVKLGKQWELVARYSRTDTGGHGIQITDGVAKTNSAVTANTLDEYYAGANYYIIGNNLKLQFGYIGGRTSGAMPGQATLNKETINGLRTQLQVNF